MGIHITFVQYNYRILINFHFHFIIVFIKHKAGQQHCENVCMKAVNQSIGKVWFIVFRRGRTWENIYQYILVHVFM